MKKGSILLFSSLSLLGVIALSSLSFDLGFKNNLRETIADDSYFVRLDESSKSLNLVDHRITTSDGNTILVSSDANVGDSGYWGKFASNQYFRNESAINGISGITIVFDDPDGYFDLYYGSNYNNLTDVTRLASGVTYNFNVYHPSYFKLVQSNNKTINVTRFDIRYSCVADGDDTSLKITGGTSIPFGLSNQSKRVSKEKNHADVHIKFNLSEAFIYSPGGLTFIFDLATQFGSLNSAANNGNGIAITLVKSGGICIGPSGYNKYMTNNKWSYWYQGVPHSVSAVGANLWLEFPFTEATVSDNKGIEVDASMNMQTGTFTFFVYANGAALGSFSIPGAINVSATGYFYPSVWTVSYETGDIVVLDDFGIYADGNKIVYTDFSNPNDICYAWPFTADLCINNTRYVSFYHKGGIMKNVDFYVDIPLGEDPFILQLTDIQIIDSSQMLYSDRLSEGAISLWAPDKIYERAFRHMRKTLQLATSSAGRRPDLIVLSGDNTYGEFDINFKMIKALINELDSYGIPWALNYGNHDQEAATGKNLWYTEELWNKLNTSYTTFTRNGNYIFCHPKYNMVTMDDLYKDAKNCLFTKGHVGVEGHANYSVGFRRAGEIIKVVYLSDSHGNTYEDAAQEVYSNNGTPFFTNKQLEWITNSQNSLNNVPAIGFCHHPFYAWAQQASMYGYADSDNGVVGHIGTETFTDFIAMESFENDERFVITNGDNGCFHKKVGKNQFVDTDFAMHNISKAHTIKGWFFGHEHCINATVTHEGVRYGFGVKASEYDDHIAGEIGGTLIHFNSSLDVTKLYTHLDA